MTDKILEVRGLTKTYGGEKKAGATFEELEMLTLGGLRRAVASSFMFSADNAHAVHPNHPELTDVNNCTYMNEGVVIKSHAGQKYTSDGMSIAVARELAERARRKNSPPVRAQRRAGG